MLTKVVQWSFDHFSVIKLDWAILDLRKDTVLVKLVMTDQN